MLGTNRDERKQFTAMTHRDPISDEELIERVRRELPAGKAGEAERTIEVIRTSRASRGLPADNLDVIDAVSTQPMRIASTHLAEVQGQHQPKTFLYFFEWESPARRGALGACHSLEMPFVWGTLDAPTQDRFAGTGPAAELLSSQMMEAWLSFARHGDPSHEGIGVWPTYETGGRHTMVFGPNTRVEAAPFEEERALFDELVYG
jgi:para-nitrobenzyl esterase